MQTYRALPERQAQMSITENSSNVIPLKNAATMPTNPDISRLEWAKVKEAWLLQLTADDEIPATYKPVAVPLAARMNHEKRGDAFPGITEQEKLSGVSRPTVIAAIQCFEARGHLIVTRSKRGKENAVNHYDPVIKPEIARALILGGVNAVLRYLITGQAVAPLVPNRHYSPSKPGLPPSKPQIPPSKRGCTVTTEPRRQSSGRRDLVHGAVVLL
jgi:hypothetical protein